MSTALAIGREVQARTGLSLRRFLRTLKPPRCATIDINGVIDTHPPALNPRGRGDTRRRPAHELKALSQVTQRGSGCSWCRIDAPNLSLFKL